MNLNTNPTERTQGTPTKAARRKDRLAMENTTHTNTNVTAIEPETCAYCGQELVHQAGVGHLPHGHTSQVVNKRGEPYVVAWDGPYVALVFHPNDIEHYKVGVSDQGDHTCRGKSDGSRCWPFYNAATCVHIDAAQASIDAGERPAPPARKERNFTLQDLYEDQEDPATRRRAGRYERKEERESRAG